MTWLTARELAGMPGMPTAEFRTREKLQRLGVPKRPRPGREGGGGMEYDCSALPEVTRTALAAKQISHSSATLSSQLPQVSATTTKPAALPLEQRAPSLADKSVADARVQLVQKVQELVPIHGIKHSCTLLAAQLVTGQCGTAVQAIARAANQRARGDNVSARTLERWNGQFRVSGWWGLLPAAQEARTMPDRLEEDVAAVLGLYHSRDPKFRKLALAAKEVTRMLNRDFDTWEALYSRARRALDKFAKSSKANVALLKARHTGSERDAKLPFKRRDTTMLAPLDVWVMDGHTFKAKVRHPDHGAPFAPELTLVSDASTRMIMGWSTSLSENVIAVGDALRHAVSQWGIPAIVYTDNGGGETAKALDCPIDGIMVRLGIDHRTGIPGKPQARGLIERQWQTHAINCARQFDSYQGSDVDGGTFRKVAAELVKEQRALRRAEQTGEVIRLSAKSPTWMQFVDAITRMVTEYNNTHRHRSLPKNASGKHMTPAEAWASKFDASLQHMPSTGELRELFMPAMLRTARRGEVQLFNQTYASDELMRRDVDGREVSVRYDIHDASWVRIYTTDGDFVCDAKWMANRIDYMPKAVVQIAREKRVAATVKRREQQIDTAMRELGSTIEPNVFSLPEPSSPFLVQPSTFEATTPSTLLGSSKDEASQVASGRPFFNSLGERYEWLMRNRPSWSDSDTDWVSKYVASDDYERLHDYYCGRGIGWSAGDENPVLKSAL